MLTIVIIATIILVGVLFMTKRNLLILIGTTSLFLGGLIYLLLRKNITNIFDCQLVENVRCCLSELNIDFVRFYLPDFLWALSLCCYLLALFNPKPAGVFCCALAVLFCGVLWEVGQYTDVFKGTGDIADIIMYLSASILAVFICTRAKIE